MVLGSMDEDRLEELFSAYRAGEISEDGWIEPTTEKERQRAVMKHDEPDDGEMFTEEQIEIMIETSQRLGPDDYPDDYPDSEELPDDPPDIDDLPISDRTGEMDEDATVMEPAWTDWFESTSPEERQQAVDRYGAPDPDTIPDTVDIPDDLQLSNTDRKSE